MKEYIKSKFLDFLYVFLNYIIAYFPCWHIRKLFYVLCGMKIGPGSRILMGTVIIKPWRIKIGRNSFINESCHIDARGGVHIGDNVSVSIGTMIISGSHKSRSAGFDYFEKEVVLDDNVWIGARCIILPGAVLKEACLIGAGSTVLTGEYDKDALYSGVPAKYIRKRNLEGKYILSWTPWFR